MQLLVCVQRVVVVMCAVAGVCTAVGGCDE